MACLLAMVGACANVKATSVSEQVAAAQSAIAARVVNPQEVIGPLVERLKSTTSPSERASVLSALTDMGSTRSSSPSYVKTYLQTTLPPVALDIARDVGADWTLRGNALMVMRELDADEAYFRQAIDIARNDRSEQQGFIASRGLLLKSWLDERLRNGVANVRRDTDVDPDKERDAIAFLKTRGLRPTFDQLRRSLYEAEPQEVGALLDAQVFTRQMRATDGDAKVWQAATDLACGSSPHNVDGIVANVKLLLERGFNVNQVDARNNSVLLSAAGDCPLPVLKALVEGGAKLSVVNASGISELSMAVLRNKWDNVAYLVDKGSRLSKKQMEGMFVEMPDEPAKRALINRGTLAK